MQSVPHPPQLVTLVLVSMHVPPQFVWPVGQHMPTLHTLPAGQTVAQVPQWALSVCSLTQVPPQLVSPRLAGEHARAGRARRRPPGTRCRSSPQCAVVGLLVDADCRRSW